MGKYSRWIKLKYGEILKELRTYELITQEQMAKIIGINRKTYGLYETQEKVIPLKYLNDLCNYFNISIDFALGVTKIKNYRNSSKEINQNLFIKRLKELRRAKHLTQSKFAQNIKLHHSSISNYESGKNMITTSVLLDICKKYNISADYLLGKIDFNG